MCASVGFLVCGDEKKKVKKKMAFKMTVILQWNSVCLDPVAGLSVLSCLAGCSEQHPSHGPCFLFLDRYKDGWCPPACLLACLPACLLACLPASLGLPCLSPGHERTGNGLEHSLKHSLTQAHDTYPPTYVTHIILQIHTQIAHIDRHLSQIVIKLPIAPLRCPAPVLLPFLPLGLENEMMGLRWSL